MHTLEKHTVKMKLCVSWLAGCLPDAQFTIGLFVQACYIEKVGPFRAHTVYRS